VAALAADPSPDVQLQVAVAARKIDGVDALAVLTEVASACGDDPLIPRIVWQNLHPLLADDAAATRLVERFEAPKAARSPAVVALIPHVVERLISRPDPANVPIERLVRLAIESDAKDGRKVAGECLALIAGRVQSAEVAGPKAAALRGRFAPVLAPLLGGGKGESLRLAAAILAASWNDPNGYPVAREAVGASGLDEKTRLDALNALIAAGDRGALDVVTGVLANPKAASSSLRGQALSALGRLDDPRVAIVVLDQYPKLEPELQPRAVELLTQRTAWGLALMNAIGRGVLPATAVNVNQVRKLLASNNPELVEQVKARWGSVREGRNQAREQVIREVRAFLRKTPGDPVAGSKVFQRLCAQCHKIYGEGQDVGPDLTSNGRGSYEQLLSNVFDPSLVIGSAFQGTTVATTDGQVLTGLLVEKSPERVVLKMQGGKVETIPGDRVDELKVSPLSLMPEDLEKQLQPQELADLFAFITLDKPPGDPAAKPLPGAQELAKGRSPR